MYWLPDYPVIDTQNVRLLIDLYWLAESANWGTTVYQKMSTKWISTSTSTVIPQYLADQKPDIEAWPDIESALRFGHDLGQILRWPDIKAAGYQSGRKSKHGKHCVDIRPAGYRGTSVFGNWLADEISPCTLNVVTLTLSMTRLLTPINYWMRLRACGLK